MKKLLITFLFLVVMFSTISAGAVTLYYNDAYHEYDAQGIRLLVNGNPVQGMHMPPLIMGDKTIVPVREAFVALGAVVSWDEAECMTEVKYKGNTVKFKIGDRNTYVNGNVVPISEDQPIPLLVGYVPENMKTMVPVRFIAEQLGLDVSWDAASRIVNISEKAPVAPAPAPVIDGLGKFGAVSVTTDAEYDYVYIETKYGISPDVTRYSNPDRIAFDFKGAQFVVPGSTVTLNGNCVNSVRFANHDSMARVVLDLKASAQPMILSSDKGILIRIKNSPNTQIIYDAFSKRAYFTGKYSGVASYANGICSVKFSNLNMQTQTIQIRDNNIFDIVIQSLENGCSVTIDGNSNLAYSDSKGFYLSEAPIISENFGGKLPELEFGAAPPVVNNFNSGVKTVIIDAGHGGSDPGAVGYDANGQAVAYESHINIAVAKLVQGKLQNAGVNVVMTRSDDTRVSLQERADLENEINPTCFVSIHCNAINKANVAGTQVYYHPESPAGTIMADNIYNSVVSITGLLPKKTQNGENLFVIRKTLSPAVLVEMAFISNESDRAYLMSPWGQEALAEAITQGILKSLNEI